MSNHMKYIVGIGLTFTMVILLQVGLYSDYSQSKPLDITERYGADEINEPYTNFGIVKQKEESWVSSIPIIGAVADGLGFIYDIMTFNVPELPLPLRAIFSAMLILVVSMMVVLIIRGI